MYPSIIIAVNRSTADGLCVLERMLLQAFGIPVPEKGCEIAVDLGVPGVGAKLKVFRGKLKEYLDQNLSWENLSSRPHCDKVGEYSRLMERRVKALGKTTLDSVDILIAAREAIAHPAQYRVTNLTELHKELKAGWATAATFTESIALVAGSVDVDTKLAVHLPSIVHLDLLDDNNFSKVVGGYLISRSLMTPQDSKRRRYYGSSELRGWFSIVIRLYAIEINSDEPPSMSHAIHTILPVLLKHVENDIAEASGTQRDDIEYLLSLRKGMEGFLEVASSLYDLRTGAMGPDTIQFWENVTPEAKIENKKDKLLALVKICHGRASLKTIVSLGKPFDVDVRQICAASADPELNGFKADLKAAEKANKEVLPEPPDVRVNPAGEPLNTLSGKKAEEIDNKGLSRFILPIVLAISFVVVGGAVVRMIMASRDSSALLHKSSVASVGLNVFKSLP